MSQEITMGHEVMDWPEFQQFAERLGLSIKDETRRISIDIAVGEPVDISHDFFGADKNKDSY